MLSVFPARNFSDHSRIFCSETSLIVPAKLPAGSPTTKSPLASLSPHLQSRPAQSHPLTKSPLAKSPQPKLPRYSLLYWGEESGWLFTFPLFLFLECCYNCLNFQTTLLFYLSTGCLFVFNSKPFLTFLLFL